MTRFRTCKLLIISLVLYQLSYLAWRRMRLETLSEFENEHLMKNLIFQFTGNLLNRFPFPGVIWNPDILYKSLEASKVCKIILAYRVTFDHPHSDIYQCKLVVNIKKLVDINKYKYICIKLVHACWENWQYALTMQVPFGDTAL